MKRAIKGRGLVLRIERDGFGMLQDIATEKLGVFDLTEPGHTRRDLKPGTMVEFVADEDDEKDLLMVREMVAIRRGQ